MKSLTVDAGRDPHRPPWTLVATPLAVLLLTWLPIILFLRVNPDFAVFATLANDTFYYLDVARSSLHLPFFSFDGAHPTNGFHPLWQVILYQLTRLGVLPVDDQKTALLRLVKIDAAIVSVALALLAIAWRRIVGRPWLVLLALCPGFLWFGMALFAPQYASGWAFVNGMETGVELLFFALAFFLLVQENASPVAIYLCLGLMTLSRLDDIFLMIPLIIFVYRRHDPAQRFQALLRASIPLTMIGAYLIYNRITVGTFMPISGAAKAGFALHSNLSSFAHIFVLSRFDTLSSNAVGSYSVFSETAMRTSQLFLPLLLCSLHLYLRSKEKFYLLEYLAIGVILKALYNIAFVNLIHQGHWYFGVSVVVSNLLIATWIKRTLDAARREDDLSPRPWRPQILLMGAVVCLALFCANVVINYKLYSTYGHDAYVLYLARAEVKEAILRQGAASFVELNDGEISFVTGVPSLSGLGLAGDLEAARARRDGNFLRLARERGASIVVASGVYGTSLESLRSQGIKEWFGLHGADINSFKLELLATVPTARLYIYRIIDR